MDEAGVPTYNELVLVANADALEREGDKIRAFIGAVQCGTLTRSQAFCCPRARTTRFPCKQQEKNRERMSTIRCSASL